MRRAGAAGAGLAIALAASGCSPTETQETSSPPPEAVEVGQSAEESGAVSPEEFWSGHQSAGLEVDPATTLNELETRAARIVTGRVVGSEPGPGDSSTMADGSTVEIDSTLLTVQVSETVAGEPAEEVVVWISAATTSASQVDAEDFPSEEYLWFLVPSERPGIDYLVSQTGIVGPWDTSAPTTVLDPVMTPEIVPEGATNVDDVVDALEG